MSSAPAPTPTCGVKRRRGGAPFLAKLDPRHLVTDLVDAFRRRAQARLDPAAFVRFLRIFDDYAAGAVDRAAALGAIGAIFHDTPDLRVGFNALMPRRQECRLDVAVPGVVEMPSPVLEAACEPESGRGGRSRARVDYTTMNVRQGRTHGVKGVNGCGGVPVSVARSVACLRVGDEG